MWYVEVVGTNLILHAKHPVALIDVCLSTQIHSSWNRKGKLSYFHCDFPFHTLFRYHLSLHLFAENEVLLKAQGAEKNK